MDCGERESFEDKGILAILKNNWFEKSEKMVWMSYRGK
jgi:hypothetical protein